MSAYANTNEHEFGNRVVSSLGGALLELPNFACSRACDRGVRLRKAINSKLRKSGAPYEEMNGRETC